jgi:hypothetical protein
LGFSISFGRDRNFFFKFFWFRGGEGWGPSHNEVLIVKSYITLKIDHKMSQKARKPIVQQIFHNFFFWFYYKLMTIESYLHL